MPVLACQYLPLTLYFASVFLFLPYALSFYWHFLLRPLHFYFIFLGASPPLAADEGNQAACFFAFMARQRKQLDSLDSVEFDVQSCSATKELCSSGQISGFAATSCQQCALGSFAGSPGMSACELCLAGTYGQLGDTEKRRALYARVCQCVGMLRHNDTSSCLQCGAGSYSQAGSTPHELRLHFCKFIGQCLFMWHSLLVIGIQHASLQPPALSF